MKMEDPSLCIDLAFLLICRSREGDSRLSDISRILCIGDTATSISIGEHIHRLADTGFIT